MDLSMLSPEEQKLVETFRANKDAVGWQPRLAHEYDHFEKSVFFDRLHKLVLFNFNHIKEYGGEFAGDKKRIYECAMDMLSRPGRYVMVELARFIKKD